MSKTPRETRSTKQRPQRWTQPDLLPVPDREPGYEYRWIRISLLNEADPRNISSKLREGWEPVSVEEQPQFKMFIDPRTRFQGSVEIGGLLLCKAPAELMRQRAEHHREVTKAQLASVDNNYMRQNDPRMPLFSERKSTHSFGSGR